MNFTREPIVETVITPKDGYKLCIRNSKLSSAEELMVDAIEVVSFGHAFFYRGLEKPKPFLVPVTDYEIFEVKEARVVLKNIAHDRNIKIGGGRDAPVRAAKEPQIEKAEEVTTRSIAGSEVSEEPLVEAQMESKVDRKRDRRRHRRRRSSDERREWTEKEKPQMAESSSEMHEQEETISKDERTASPMFTNLIPPPSTLISEKLSRYKEKESVGDPGFSDSLKNDVVTTFFQEEKEEIYHFPSTPTIPPQSGETHQEEDFFS